MKITDVLFLIVCLLLCGSVPTLVAGVDAQWQEDVLRDIAEQSPADPVYQEAVRSLQALVAQYPVDQIAALSKEEVAQLRKRLAAFSDYFAQHTVPTRRADGDACFMQLQSVVNTLTALVDEHHVVQQSFLRRNKKTLFIITAVATFIAGILYYRHKRIKQASLLARRSVIGQEFDAPSVALSDAGDADGGTPGSDLASAQAVGADGGATATEQEDVGGDSDGEDDSGAARGDGGAQAAVASPASAIGADGGQGEPTASAGLASQEVAEVEAEHERVTGVAGDSGAARVGSRRGDDGGEVSPVAGGVQAGGDDGEQEDVRGDASGRERDAARQALLAASRGPVVLRPVAQVASAIGAAGGVAGESGAQEGPASPAPSATDGGATATKQEDVGVDSDGEDESGAARVGSRRGDDGGEVGPVAGGVQAVGADGEQEDVRGDASGRERDAARQALLAAIRGPVVLRPVAQVASAIGAAGGVAGEPGAQEGPASPAPSATDGGATAIEQQDVEVDSDGEDESGAAHIVSALFSESIRKVALRVASDLASAQAVGADGEQGEPTDSAGLASREAAEVEDEHESVTVDADDVATQQEDVGVDSDGEDESGAARHTDVRYLLKLANKHRAFGQSMGRRPVQSGQAAARSRGDARRITAGHGRALLRERPGAASGGSGRATSSRRRAKHTTQRKRVRSRSAHVSAAGTVLAENVSGGRQMADQRRSEVVVAETGATLREPDVASRAGQQASHGVSDDDVSAVRTGESASAHTSDTGAAEKVFSAVVKAVFLGGSPSKESVKPPRECTSGLTPTDTSIARFLIERAGGQG